ncbi:hypothetical protein HPB48_005182 [Haemaphysalis longicornis]|uniref:Uncharacterized protein n=1 Tax=Haemaphysalis longicornis TaxID=44386 RepID=A0A9J6FH33_HAELO|nr:hypothetical protein HPB48_005182 [Haemaphysalis longicornis]
MLKTCKVTALARRGTFSQLGYHRRVKQEMFCAHLTNTEVVLREWLLYSPLHRIHMLLSLHSVVGNKGPIFGARWVQFMEQGI